MTTTFESPGAPILETRLGSSPTIGIAGLGTSVTESSYCQTGAL